MSMLCGQLNHHNIIQFLGVAIRDDFGACLVLPWMEKGDSLAYVQKYPHVQRLPIVCRYPNLIHRYALLIRRQMFRFEGLSVV